MRHDLEPLGLLDRVRPSVRLKVGEDNIDSSLGSSTAIREHLKSLSNACRIAQINF